ncbi:MAG: flagellar motor switch protein FliG [Rhodobacter sp.]|nr:flagellar motor switch protein FliG [Rhodobacter sp.]
MQPDIPLPGATLPPPSAPPTRRLSRRQKAAIVVRLLRAEGVTISLADLPDDLQVGLTEAMSAMRYIDRKTLQTVVTEFVSELDCIGLAFPRDVTGALHVLDGTLSDSAAAHLRNQAGIGTARDPWDRIADLDAARLLPILQEESTEIGAVMLSKLKVSKSAELLGMLPGERARRITYAVSQTGAIAPATVQRIGEALVAQLDAQAPTAFASGPVERVGAILNSSAAATRDRVLEGLQAEDQDFADEVRKAIFTFVNIPDRIDPRDVPKITRDVDAAVLTCALAAALPKPEEAKAAEFILANMSQRMATQLRDEVEGLGKVKEKDGESAMGGVIAAIRDLEEKGEIRLIVEEAENAGD